MLDALLVSRFCVFRVTVVVCSWLEVFSLRLSLCQLVCSCLLLVAVYLLCFRRRFCCSAGATTTSLCAAMVAAASDAARLGGGQSVAVTQ